MEHLYVIHVSQVSGPFASMIHPVADRPDALMLDFIRLDQLVAAEEDIHEAHLHQPSGSVGSSIALEFLRQCPLHEKMILCVSGQSAKLPYGSLQARTCTA